MYTHIAMYAWTCIFAYMCACVWFLAFTCMCICILVLYSYVDNIPLSDVYIHEVTYALCRVSSNL